MSTEVLIECQCNVDQELIEGIDQHSTSDAFRAHYLDFAIFILLIIYCSFKHVIFLLLTLLNRLLETFAMT